MGNPLVLNLLSSREQFVQLAELQKAFAAVCNAIAPVSQANRCWNRVALHHLVYHEMRRRFPQMGSQMVCNAVYSVCRSYRLILNHPKSPWNLSQRGDKPLPLLQFAPSAPVYFDRHTLTLAEGRLSMYTLDGRLHFHLDITPADQQRFLDEKLREIHLTQRDGGYQLQFWFGAAEAAEAQAGPDLPEYLLTLPATAAGSEQVAVARVPPSPRPSPSKGEGGTNDPLPSRGAITGPLP